MDSGHSVESRKGHTTRLSKDDLETAALVLIRHLLANSQSASQEASPAVEPWLTLEAAAQHASVSEDTLREWIASGLLPVGRVKRVIRVRRSDIDDLLTGRNGSNAEGGDNAAPGVRDGYSDTSRAILTKLKAKPSAGR